MVLKIIADSREPLQIINSLKNLDVRVETEQLVIGDYILSDKLIVERKTGPDFVQSLYDNRLFTQCHQLIDNYDEVIIVLENYEDIRITDKSISGALSYLVLKRGISIIPSSNHVHTASVLERLASWEQEEKKDPILSRIAPKRMTLDEKREFLIQGLDGVGLKTAQMLLGHFVTPEEVFSGIKLSKVEYTKSGNPKRIIGPLEAIKGIGPKFVIKNQELLTSR